MILLSFMSMDSGYDKVTLPPVSGSWSYAYSVHLLDLLELISNLLQSFPYFPTALFPLLVPIRVAGLVHRPAQFLHGGFNLAGTGDEFPGGTFEQR